MSAQFGETRLDNERPIWGDAHRQLPYLRRRTCFSTHKISAGLTEGAASNAYRGTAHFEETWPISGDSLPSFGRRCNQLGETVAPYLERRTAQFGETRRSLQTLNYSVLSRACITRQFPRQDQHVVIDKININNILMLSFLS